MGTAPEWETILTEVVGAFLTGKLSFVVGDVAVSISSVAGAPVKFTFGTAIFAAENIFLGSTGVLQVGNILVTIATIPKAVSNASPAAATIASVIAASIVPAGAAILGSQPSVSPANVGAEPVNAAPSVSAASSAETQVAGIGQLSSIQPGEPGYTVHQIPV